VWAGGEAARRAKKARTHRALAAGTARFGELTPHHALRVVPRKQRIIQAQAADVAVLANAL
jgi:hypothetical protein